MTEIVKSDIYQGKKIPLNSLSPEAFEDFMYGILKIIFKPTGITIIGKSGSIGDGGFDIDGKNSNSEIICFQCKRYPETDLDLNKVANELAKVALRSYAENSNIVEHYIITSGKVMSNVESARRDSTKKLLKDSAVKEVNNIDNFLNDKKKIRASNPNIHFDQIVISYIEKLKTIHIWNSGQLDSEIGSVYSKTNDLRERYFNIENVLLEYPRPDFDERNYLNRFIQGPKYIKLNYSPDKLP
ncbi:MAG: restriction endonuclease, partial [Leptospira sp.]|nr:restriction endonuclease [Leptospira sp.]